VGVIGGKQRSAVGWAAISVVDDLLSVNMALWYSAAEQMTIWTQREVPLAAADGGAAVAAADKREVQFLFA
jgi:hypothetical protein